MVSFAFAGPALSAASPQKITFCPKGACFFSWSCSVYVAGRSLGCNSFPSLHQAFIETHILLLSIRQSNLRCIYSIILAILLELCDNPNTLSHVLKWRDGNGQTAPRVLLQLWSDEEKTLSVDRNPQGVIAGQPAGQRLVLTK